MMDHFEDKDVENMEELDEQGKEVQKEAQKKFKAIIVSKGLPQSFSAETNREFIFTAFRHLREAHVPETPRDLTVTCHAIEVSATSVHDIPTKLKGLYLIYECRDDKEEIPIYIGFTGVSFRTRFRSHMRRGVLKKFFEMKPTGHLKVDLVPTLYQAHAKLLESVFLLSFDFILNKEENQQERSILKVDVEKIHIHVSRLYFDIAYKVVLKEINDVHQHYIDNIGKSP